MSLSDSPPSSLPSIPDPQPSTSRGGLGVPTASTNGTDISQALLGSERRSCRRGRSGSRGKVGRGVRGIGRGTQQSSLEEDPHRIARNQQTMGAIDKISHEKLKKKMRCLGLCRSVSDSVGETKTSTIMATVVEREPSEVFDLCAAPPMLPSDSNPPVTEEGFPECCVCHNCEKMEKDIEKLCCGCLPDACISKRLEVDTIVLDQQTLAIEDGYFRVMPGRHSHNYNEIMRFTAYRNFTVWKHGRLGANIRRVVPSCVVMRIRKTFPSATGSYAGFRSGRFY